MKLLALIVVAPLAACVTEPASGPDPEPEITNYLKLPCPPWGCTENSPVMGPYEFHELNTAGLANDEGVRILNFEKAGLLYRPVVTSATLSAIPLTSNTPLTGSQLLGGWFNLQTPAGVYKLEITNVHTDGPAYWVGNMNQRNESYELLYEAPGATAPSRLCNQVPDDYALDSGGKPIEQKYESMLFTGDRYDATAKEVIASSYSTTAGWFNIACAGSAVAKLHLNRHTTASSPGPNLVTTTWRQRQALLKMYVSDTCGTGEAFTNKGTPLWWRNSYGWGSTNDFYFARESFWSETGALCLDTHRLGGLFLGAIQAACTAANHPLPPCAFTSNRGVYLRSAIP